MCFSLPCPDGNTKLLPHVCPTRQGCACSSLRSPWPAFGFFAASLRYFKKNPDLWTEECDEVMKELIAINTGKAN